MNKCLVTTLDARIDNENLLAPDEFIIKIHPKDIGAASRWLIFHFFAGVGKLRIRSPQNIEGETPIVKMYTDSACSNPVSDDGVNLDYIAPAVDKTIYFPSMINDEDLLEDYEVIVSNKFNLATVRCNESLASTYNFFELNLADLRYCSSFYRLALKGHIINGDLSDLSHITQFGNLNCTRTAFSGDIANLKNHKSLYYFKAAYSDVYGDISVVKEMPYLHNFEAMRSLGVYGNLSAFREHHSINYLTLPGAIGHPCIEGDIADLADCNSLSYFWANNERNITGTLNNLCGEKGANSATPFAKVIRSIYLTGTSISGSVGSLNNCVNLGHVEVGNSYSLNYFADSEADKVSGNIEDLLDPDNPMNYLNWLGLAYTHVAGNMRNTYTLKNNSTEVDKISAPALSYLYLGRTNITGDISDFYKDKFPSLNATLSLSNCPNITGNIPDDLNTETQGFCKELSALDLTHIGATGKLSKAIANCTNLATLTIQNTLFDDDITEIYTADKTRLISGNVLGCVNMHGDLSKLPKFFNALTSGGLWDGVFSWETLGDTTAKRMYLMNVNLADDVEKMLVAQACRTDNPTTRTIRVFGKYNWNTISEICQKAITVLQNDGFSITINGILISQKLDGVSKKALDYANTDKSAVNALFPRILS